jgi:hypothetical protein
MDEVSKEKLEGGVMEWIARARSVIDTNGDHVRE